MVRSLLRTPSFTVAAILSLALGIGANSAIFSVASALLLKPLPYATPDRLVILWNTSPGIGILEDWFSTAQYFDIRGQVRGLDEVAIAIGGNENLIGHDGEAARVGTVHVSSNLLPMLGVTPLHGQLFSSADDLPGGERKALLGHGTFVRRFGADPAVLGRAIQNALRRRDTMLEGQQINQWLKEEVALRVAERRLEQAAQERISVATLEALVNALEAKDPHLRGHSARVADLSASVAAQLGCSDETVEAIRTGGRLHDIGKIGIREEVLNKQGPLTDEEYEHVKQHVLVGSQILAPLVHLQEVITYVRSHHERWDGFGYPDRLAGEGIPLGGRIIGAVEIYDALTTSRPYQEKMPPEVAVERMRDLVGTVLDPAVHRALEAVVTQRQALVFLDDVVG